MKYKLKKIASILYKKNNRVNYGFNSQKSNIDKIARYVAVIGLLLAFYNIYTNINLNSQNNKLQIEQFNFSNAPELIIDSLQFEEYQRMGSYIENDTILIAGSFSITNKSLQTLKILVSSTTISRELNYILRNYILTGNDKPKYIESEFVRNDIYDNLLPNHTTKYFFLFKEDKLDFGYNRIHHHIIYQSDKYGLYDKYLIINMDLESTPATKLIMLETNDTTVIPSKLRSNLLPKYLDTIQGNYKLYKDKYTLRDYSYDSHIYTLDEIEKLKSSKYFKNINMLPHFMNNKFY